jgi:hypothetical protein
VGEGEHELARTRFNRCGPLLELGRLEEAERVLEGCLAVFRRVGDLSGEGMVLSVLASSWNKREDPEQAAGLERQALAVHNRLSDLATRSISHYQLANYLDRLGLAEEAARHQLATIVYFLITSHGQYLATIMRGLAIGITRAAASGERYELPRLTELLARPEFEPLQRTLTEWNVALDELQAKIDELVEEGGGGWRGAGEAPPEGAQAWSPGREPRVQSVPQIIPSPPEGAAAVCRPLRGLGNHYGLQTRGLRPGLHAGAPSGGYCARHDTQSLQATQARLEIHLRAGPVGQGDSFPRLWPGTVSYVVGDAPRSGRAGPGGALRRNAPEPAAHILAGICVFRAAG